MSAPSGTTAAALPVMVSDEALAAFRSAQSAKICMGSLSNEIRFVQQSQKGDEQ